MLDENGQRRAMPTYGVCLWPCPFDGSVLPRRVHRNTFGSLDALEQASVG